MNKGLTAAAIVRGVFLAACLGFIFSLIAVRGIAFLGCPVPNWMIQDEKNSVLEGRKYQPMPKLSLSAFFEKEYQGQFEQWVSDLTPNRDAVIMANAGLQRQAIAASAAIFKYDLVPTYFCSDNAYDSTSDAVFPIPVKTTSEDYADKLPQAVDAFNGFAERFPGKNIVFADVERLEFSGLNPLSRLVSIPVNSDYVEDAFLDALNGSIKTIRLSCATMDEYFSKFFRTDHHWNTPGAYDGYEKCLAALRPLDRPVLVEDEVVWSDVPFFGSRTRAALCETRQPDRLIDYLYDESNLLVEWDGEFGLEKLRHFELYSEGGNSARRYANHYADYFHNDKSLFTIENMDCEGGDTLLIVGDSYTNAMERFFAEHYERVVVVDPRDLDGTMDEVMAEYDPDDVLFLMAGFTYTNSRVLEFVSN